MTLQKLQRLSPSLLARKILCVAYVPKPFGEEDRFRFQTLHAFSMIKVIARHLRSGYRLTGIEQRGRGYIIDLMFEAISTGRKRLNEVKSSKTIREVHRIQAALYAGLPIHGNIDEVVVSNKENDEILNPSFIEDVHRRAEATREMLVNHPYEAATRYTPHDDICYTCGNTACPFQVQTPAQRGEKA